MRAAILRVAPINEHPPGGGQQERIAVTGKGGLAGAVGAHNGHPFARLDGYAHAIQGRFFVGCGARVAIGDSVKLDQ